MSLNRYSVIPNAAMNMFYNFNRFEDLKLLDYSTCGHGITDLGEIPYLVKNAKYRDQYSLYLSELDIALGAISKVNRAVKEIINNHDVDHIFLMKSSLTETIGIDIDGLCLDLSEEFNKDIFTIDYKLKDDFYVGERRYYSKLADYLKEGSSRKRNSFNIIGDSYSDWSYQKHRAIQKLLERKGKFLTADILSISKIADLSKLTQGELNIVTSVSALPLAITMKEKFGIDYLYFTDLFDKKIHIDKRVIAYGDVDLLNYLKAVFDCKELTLICSHKNKCGYHYSTIDSFIDEYKGNDDVKVTYCECKEFLKNVLAATSLGQDYDSEVRDIYDSEEFITDLLMA